MIAAASALVLFASACSSAPTEEPAPGGETIVGETNNDSPAEQTNDAEFEATELEGALVDSFPHDVPLYNGLIEKSSASLSEVSNKPEWAVLMSTSDPLEAVDVSIRESYSTNGWTIGSDMESAGGFLLVARGNGYIVSITYNDLTGDGITITYGVSAS